MTRFKKVGSRILKIKAESALVCKGVDLCVNYHCKRTLLSNVTCFVPYLLSLRNEAAASDQVFLDRLWYKFL